MTLTCFCEIIFYRCSENKYNFRNKSASIITSDQQEHRHTINLPTPNEKMCDNHGTEPAVSDEFRLHVGSYSCNGPMKKRIRHIEPDFPVSVLKEVSMNTSAMTTLPEEPSKVKNNTWDFIKKYQQKQSSGYVIGFATPSPSQFVANRLKSYTRYQDMGDTSTNLLGSPLSASLRDTSIPSLPIDVVDLDVDPRSRLKPMRPSPIDNNTVYLSVYGKCHYEAKFELDEKLGMNETYLEDKSQGKWTISNHKRLRPYRALLIDWLSRNISVRFRLNVETLHIAVGILDQYMELAHVDSNMFICLGW